MRLASFLLGTLLCISVALAFVSSQVSATTTAHAATAAAAAAHPHPHHKQHQHGGLQFTVDASNDEITSLPGLNTTLNFRQFAGYLDIPNTKKHIFYWLVLSQNDPTTDPVFWWSNGGPGCSGLLGFLTEHGPFRMEKGSDNTLRLNPYSWNTVANMLYVEAPVGVGFSYEDGTSEYYTGDQQTAIDNYQSLLTFFGTKFPQFKNNPFYISSESYGGHYVPTLTYYILEQFKQLQPTQLPFQLKGVLVGNPYTDPIENSVWGQAGTFCGHALASYPTCQTFKTACNANPSSDDCSEAVGNVAVEIGDLDSYGLDYPVCLQNAQQRKLLQHLKKAGKFHPALARVYGSRNVSASASSVGDVDPAYDPCGQDEETVYLNNPDVQKAIHVNTDQGISWSGCSGVVDYDSSDMQVYMEPLWQSFLNSSNLHLTIFSGDDDSVCATLGTESWIYGLSQVSVATPWTSWTDSLGQTGGHYTRFQGTSTSLNFVTVHSAGHMVPTYTPGRALDLLKNYLAGTY